MNLEALVPQRKTVRKLCSMLSAAALASAGVSGFAAELPYVVTTATPLSSVSAADRPSPRSQADLLQTFADEPSGTAAALSPYFVAAVPANSYQWNMMLDKYLNDPDAIGLARFNYGALHANADDRAALAAYIETLEGTDVAALSTDEAIAFWANLYNAVTIKVVIDNYPVKSIREIKSGWRAGPWKRNLVTVNGKSLSLDDIEHDILRKQYPSPLLHYMVNCAHPSHYLQPVIRGGKWLERIGGVRSNASVLSHAELDEAESLDEGNPQEFAHLHKVFIDRLPNLRVFGGCCGTDCRHVQALAETFVD